MSRIRRATKVYITDKGKRYAEEVVTSGRVRSLPEELLLVVTDLSGSTVKKIMDYLNYDKEWFSSVSGALDNLANGEMVMFDY